MANRVDSLPDPPDAPEHQGRVSLYRFQLIGLPFILALPVLAMLGVFGERWATEEASAGDIAASVRYPTVFRYKMIDEIELLVSNRGSVAIDTITVSLDAGYATKFSTINAVPPFTGPFEVSLPAVAAGESRRVRIEIQAERYWRHAGELTVRSDRDTARIRLTTTVFP